MAHEISILTASEFDAWVMRPENTARNFEFINGEIVEKMVSNQKSSRIAARLLALIDTYAMQHEIGWVTDAQGGYRVGNERYIPDAAYVSKTRQPEPSDDAYNPIAPDLAVEVISPTDSYKEVSRKVTHYRAANATVWVALPDEQEIEVHVPGQPVQILKINDTLNGGTVLPGFSVPLTRIFQVGGQSGDSKDKTTA
jgi:Uma2 family endonuclease